MLDSTDISEKDMNLGNVDISKGISVVLDRPTTISQIGLYDNPDSKVNILGGYIQLDNGNKIDFKELEKNGELTYITIPKTVVNSFTVNVTSFEGTSPQIMEIEAYKEIESCDTTDSFLMLMDEDDNFVYDYLIDDGSKVALDLYSYPQSISVKDVKVELLENVGCSYKIQNEKIVIDCPSKSSCTVKVTYNDISCMAKIKNISFFKELEIKCKSRLDYELNLNQLSIWNFDGQIRYYKMFFSTIFEKIGI